MSIIEQDTNGVATNPVSITMHEALHKMLARVVKAGHSQSSVKDVRIIARTNPSTGLHVHATCSIKLRFDESVTEEEAQRNISKY